MVNPRAVIDVFERAVIVTDAEGRILLWNHAAEGLYGWTEEKVLGRSVVDVLASPDQKVEDAADLGLIADGLSMSGDRLVLRSDGVKLRVNTSTAPMVDEHGEVIAIVGTSQDVADLRIQEQGSRDLSEHLRSALEAGGLGTWRWDMASGTTIWDEHLEKLFGLEPGGFDGSFDTYVGLLHPEDRGKVLDSVADALETRSSYRVDHRVVWPDGSIRWLVGVGGVSLNEVGHVIGTVGCVMDITDRVRNESELRRLAELAERAADSERLQRERLEFLTKINRALSKSLTIRDVMVNVTKQAVPRLGDWCAIHVMGASGHGVPDVEVAHSDPAMVQYARELQDRFPYDPDALAGVPAVMRTGETEFYPEITSEILSLIDQLPDVKELLERLDLGSAITVPLKKRGRVLGVLQFVASSSSRRYTTDDVALAETVAARIAASLDNLRLHDEQREIAQTLQLSLLPPSLPELRGIDTAARYWPNGEANEVGGDFYDLFALESSDHYAVVLGDVCGKGAGAAALTGLARHTIRDSAWHGDTHHGVLNSVNRAVLRSGYDTFLTCMYATLQIAEEATTLTVACGGHPLPTLVRGGGAPSAIGQPGTLLGLLEDIVLHATSVALEPGDVVVFHTDGATDVAPPHDLDDAQWMELVARAARQGGSAEDIADHIRASLEAILGFATRDDDIALLVLAVEADPN